MDIAPESPSDSALVVAENATPSAPVPASNFWILCGRGANATGRAFRYAAVSVAQTVSSAYLSVDADVRRHVAQLPLMGLTYLAAKSRGAQPIANDGHRPVIFVHGLGGNPGNFLPMRKFLALNGRKRTYAATLSAATIEENAEQLTHLIEEVIRVNELPADATIDLVGHSMGGLVARLALENPAICSRVATLVTLGTPHTGTYAARFGGTPNARELRPGSLVLERLRAQLPWRGPPHQPRLVTLWSRADVLLLPAESALASGAIAVEMTNFTHYSYLLHPAAWSRLLAILDAAAFAHG